MKKAAIMLTMLIVCIGCECKKKHCDNPKNDTANPIGLEKAVRNGEIKGARLRHIATSSTSFSTVVIKTSAATKTWRARTNPNGPINNLLIYKEYANYCYINIGLIKSGSDQAKWLETNKNIIEYDITKHYIEYAHRIYFPELIPELHNLKDSDFKTVNATDLLTEIGSSILYPNYINFDITGANAVPKRTTVYTSGAPPDVFSATLLTSIIKTNQVGPTDLIGVAVVPQYPHDFTCLKVFKTGAVYNYSNEPR